jgi:transcriptional regulator with XRE-family HTH domain
MGIGRALKRLRAKSNLTQREYAAKIGISQTAYSALENNKSYPSKETLTAIAALFKTTPAMIILSDIDIDKDLTPKERALFNIHFPNFSERINEIINSYKGK